MSFQPMLCPFCNEREAQHNGKKYKPREHIPCAGLFVTHANDHLITVPSCDSCNGGTSGTDQKFLHNISLYLGVNSEEKTLLRNRYNRAAEKDNSIIRSLEEQQAYLGRDDLFLFDQQVLLKTLLKWTRGLYFHIHNEKKRISRTVEIDLDLIPQGQYFPLNLIQLMSEKGSKITKGKGIFEVEYFVSTDSPDISLWLYRLYGEDIAWFAVRPK